MVFSRKLGQKRGTKHKYFYDAHFNIMGPERQRRYYLVQGQVRATKLPLHECSFCGLGLGLPTFRGLKGKKLSAQVEAYKKKG